MTYNKNEQTVSLCSHHQQNHFMRAFLRDIILRPSCYHCQAKSGRSHSDITIADFWGINTEIADMDDDKGTGLVLINTDKGLSALDWSKMTSKETTAEVAFSHNPAYFRSVSAHPKREEFFNRIDETESVNFLIIDCLRPTFKQCFRTFILLCKQLIKRLLISAVGVGDKKKVKQSKNISITSLSEYACIYSITFRNKQQGWKSYRMEITFKN